MNKTLEVEQRAYLNIGVMTLDPNDGVIILPVENSGKLPATDATYIRLRNSHALAR